MLAGTQQNLTVFGRLGVVKKGFLWTLQLGPEARHTSWNDKERPSLDREDELVNVVQRANSVEMGGAGMQER